MNGRLVLDMLLELNRTEQTTLILVTHDAELASHADRLINLRDGVVESDETRREPQMRTDEHQ